MSSDDNRTSKPLRLKIIELSGQEQLIFCDSVHLDCKNDEKGQHGGKIGIRRGHIKTLITLAKGVVAAYVDGENIHNEAIDAGIAMVENDVVTILKSSV